LQERKKKYEQNLVLRKRTTETTPQRKIQELQERASQRQIKREKIENRRVSKSYAKDLSLRIVKLQDVS
jgi:hypothetical protein